MSPPPPSLLPPNVEALIGEITVEPVSAEITAKESQRYAQSIGDLNPVYFDEKAALAAGYRTLTCPPTFLDHVVVVGRTLEDLRTDGLFRNEASPRLALKRVMFGGQEWDWLADVHVGDTITGTQRLAGVQEKAGGKGPFVLVTWETEFVNQDGDVVARSRLQGISR